MSYGISATAAVVVVTAATYETKNQDEHPGAVSAKSVITHRKDLLFVFQPILCVISPFVTKKPLCKSERLFRSFNILKISELNIFRRIINYIVYDILLFIGNIKQLAISFGHKVLFDTFV